MWLGAWRWFFRICEAHAISTSMVGTFSPNENHYKSAFITLPDFHMYFPLTLSSLSLSSLAVFVHRDSCRMTYICINVNQINPKKGKITFRTLSWWNWFARSIQSLLVSVSSWTKLLLKTKVGSNFLSFLYYLNVS